MSKLRDLDLAEVTARAASALARATGRATTLTAAVRLSDAERRNLIVRAVATDDGGAARPVIVKATRAADYDPADVATLGASGLIREWIATALLVSRAPHHRHGSALLAGDVSAGILVFADLGTGLRSLVDPLLHGSADDAERALTAYAFALAALHADTISCRSAYDEAFRSILGAERARARPSLAENVAFVTDRIGPGPPPDEVELLAQRLSDPGPWLALVHGDPCPDNALILDGSVRLIDYEFAGPAHALLDGSYWRMGFPSCWCAGRVPADVVARVEASYRAELARSIPLARDDSAYRAELAYMATVSMFIRFTWLLESALESDETWGIATKRARLLFYLEAVIELTEAARVLPGIGAAAKGWLAQLRGRWPDTTPLALYPAFAAPPP